MARAGIPLLAVLIDADNSSPAWAEAIFEEIASLGEASVRRIYGDFSRSQLKGWSDRLAALALVPHHQPANTVGKNASDIALVIDAMDILHSGRFDGFVLVSSDSDFTRLASRIREQGLDVYGIGQHKTPEAFRKACKRFIFIENLIGETEPDSTPDRKAEPAPKKDSPAKAVPLIEAAMRAIDPDGEWYSLGQIGQFVTAQNPDFDSRSYGSAKLSDLIAKTGHFEMKRGEGNQTLARSKPRK
ncbi:MAG: NYN domain-containing protein [Gemmobacter sp.]